MNEFYKLGIVCMLAMNAKAISDVTCSNGKGVDSCANVVSHTFCEQNMPSRASVGKKTLEEVHTFAELKHDPGSALPQSTPA